MDKDAAFAAGLRAKAGATIKPSPEAAASLKAARARDATARRVEAEQIASLFRANRLGVLLEPVVGGGLAWYLWRVTNSDLAALWLLAVWAIASLRGLLVYRYQQAMPPPSEARHWGHPYTIGATAAGLAWGAGIITLWPGGSLLDQLLLSLLIAAVAAFQSGMMASLLSTSYLYLGSVVLVMFGSLAWRHAGIHLLILGMVVLYCVILLLINRHMNRLLVDALRLRFELSAAGEAAEAASRAKSEFIANMSHELRTPLNAVIGFSEMMMGEMFGPLGSPRYLDYSADIYRSGRHLLEVINDILDLSKVESGKMELTEERIDLLVAIEAALRLIEQGAEKAGVTLIWEPPPNPVHVVVDERAIRQALLNLLSNAVKFTPVGGEVGITLARDTEGGLIIEVRDTGIGMAPEDIPRAMEPFVRVEGVMTRHYEGTGLGLPLVKSLITLHGGSFDLESAPGVGTTAIVRLPPRRVSSGALTTPPPAPVSTPLPPQVENLPKSA